MTIKEKDTLKKKIVEDIIHTKEQIESLKEKVKPSKKTLKSQYAEKRVLTLFFLKKTGLNKSVIISK